MSARSGRSILRALYEPALKGTATAGKVVVADSNTNVTGLTLTNSTFINPVTAKTYTPSATTLTAVGGQTILLGTAAGVTVTLPAAIGSGKAINAYVTVIPTGSYIVQVANSTDFMIGQIQTTNGATVTGYIAANSGTVATNSDTLTLNHTTTGGTTVGNTLRFEDIANNTWLVSGETTSSGTTATPFSAAV